MKVVILAGGFGTRISEESQYKPKPMVEIGGMPILWHIMKGYSHFGFNDFVICAGYKQHMVKEWFSNYFLYTSDVTFDFTSNNKTVIHHRHGALEGHRGGHRPAHHDRRPDQADSTLCGGRALPDDLR